MKNLILVLTLVLLAYSGSQIYNKRYLIKSVQNYVKPSIEKTDEALAEIELPEGFIIKYFAKNVENARSMAISDSGIVYVGTRLKGRVYALIDKDNDYSVDEVVVVADNLTAPNGVVWHEGDLYVAEQHRIIVFRDIDKNYENSPDSEVLYDELPNEVQHGWKYLALGPDEKLYVPVGAPCNICNTENSIFSTINRLDLNGENFETIARGIRNTVGFDWHPETDQLYFTENGRDWLGDDSPPDEFNLVRNEGDHFGYPFCHGSDIKDPEFGGDANCEDYEKPVSELGPHVAALGVRFYDAENFPEEYKNIAFIAEHGSWNRTVPIGYRVTTVDPETGNYDTFAEGWLDGEDAWGRPVDVELLEDGSMLVSDDLAGAIYRIVYVGN